MRTNLHTNSAKILYWPAKGIVQVVDTFSGEILFQRRGTMALDAAIEEISKWKVTWTIVTY